LMPPTQTKKLVPTIKHMIVIRLAMVTASPP
jgi:hypothetical protein